MSDIDTAIQEIFSTYDFTATSFTGTYTSAWTFKAPSDGILVFAEDLEVGNWCYTPSGTITYYVTCGNEYIISETTENIGTYEYKNPAQKHTRIKTIITAGSSYSMEAEEIFTVCAYATGSAMHYVDNSNLVWFNFNDCTSGASNVQDLSLLFLSES